MIINLTFWESLDSISIEVDEQAQFVDLLNAIPVQKKSPMCMIFYLPTNGLWDKDRIKISNTNEFRRAISLDRINIIGGDTSCCWFVINEPKAELFQPSRSLNLFLQESIFASLRNFDRGSRNESSSQVNLNEDVNNSNHTSSLNPSIQDQSNKLGDGFDDNADILNSNNSSMKGDHVKADPTVRGSLLSGGLSSRELEFNQGVCRRDNLQCVVCNETRGIRAVHILEWHHIFLADQLAHFGLEGFNDIRNGITLCDVCEPYFMSRTIDIRVRMNEKNEWHHELMVAPSLCRQEVTWRQLAGQRILTRCNDDGCDDNNSAIKFPSREIWNHREATNFNDNKSSGAASTGKMPPGCIPFQLFGNMFSTAKYAPVHCGNE